MRVWELAESLRITTSELLALIAAHDPYVTSHLATVPEIAVRAIEANPPAPTRTASDYYWHVEPRLNPASPAHPHVDTRPFPWRGQRPRRRPGPRPVSFEPPYEEDERGWGNDPLADLRFEPIWSTRDVARYYGVKPATVRKWVARGYLTPEGKEGPSHVFRRSEVMAAKAAINARRNVLCTPKSTTQRSPGPRPLKPTELDRLSKVTPGSLLTTAEVAVMLGLTPATVRSWLRRGYLTAHPTSTPRRSLVSIADVHSATRRDGNRQIGAR